MTLREYTLRYVAQVAEANKGHRARTAKALGVSVRGLRNMIHEARSLGISVIEPYCNAPIETTPVKRSVAVPPRDPRCLTCREPLRVKPGPQVQYCGICLEWIKTQRANNPPSGRVTKQEAERIRLAIKKR